MKIKIGSIVRVLFGVYFLYTGLYVRNSNSPAPARNPENFSIPDGSDVNYRALFSTIKSINNTYSTYSEKTHAFDKVLKMATESKDNKFKAKCMEGLTFISDQSSSPYSLRTKALDYIEQIKDSAVPEEEEKSD